MYYNKICFYLLFLALTNISCSNLDNIIYKPNIYQGNYLLIEDIKKINKGMTKKQVIDILGYPIIRNYFNLDIWNYVLITQLNNKITKKSILTLYFNKNNLIKVSYTLNKEKT